MVTMIMHGLFYVCTAKNTELNERDVKPSGGFIMEPESSKECSFPSFLFVSDRNITTPPPPYNLSPHPYRTLFCVICPTLSCILLRSPTTITQNTKFEIEKQYKRKYEVDISGRPHVRRRAGLR